MGIIANATINSTDGATHQAPASANLKTSMTNKKAIIKALKKDAGPLENVTLDRLVVLPFTAPFNATPNGTYGYWTFTPAMQCWRGYPKDCDGDLEEDLDGYPAVVCGFRLKSNGTHGNGTSYEGNASFVERYEEDALIRSEIRPWPEFNRAREMAREWDEADMFMRMKFTIFFLILFPTASLSLSKRSCKTFKLESPNDSKGYFDMGGATRLSELVNCTAERAKENGDDRGRCKIQSSKIGIILNSTITDTYNMLLDTSLENKKSILEAVRDVASPKTMEYVNLEGLVVIPYTNSSLVIPKGKRGYWMFAADMNCWPGILDDCDNDDDLDNTDVVSQAVIAGPYVFLSGQIPIDSTGKPLEGSIADKTHACCKSVQAVLSAAGSDISRVAKVTVFLDDMKNFAEFNAVYETYFTHKPARSCVAVKTLPKNLEVEIECMALTNTKGPRL
ncbi:RidA family [Fusarium oxysporum f. sp. vasinfectum]|uniref:Uncharacterized protein n=1 Tax=Fusarium oxysporum f. sp. vasinfectum 25433 TaxID=1089449 RepID=X0KYW7_FUSOX|nr:hypothetical protein FOTG_13142 [Fusarium oxysporum f. sp. vasinfectum 25433]KAK2668298.1 RidA family [Fusarium oxysporum f. sp. vasinfectum]KAK2926047.1 RidA family [Fusarium oxysporum f. sp. vasinfectum]